MSGIKFKLFMSKYLQIKIYTIICHEIVFILHYLCTEYFKNFTQGLKFVFDHNFSQLCVPVKFINNIILII